MTLILLEWKISLSIVHIIYLQFILLCEWDCLTASYPIKLSFRYLPTTGRRTAQADRLRSCSRNTFRRNVGSSKLRRRNEGLPQPRDVVLLRRGRRLASGAATSPGKNPFIILNFETCLTYIFCHEHAAWFIFLILILLFLCLIITFKKPNYELTQYTYFGFDIFDIFKY